MSRDRNNNSQSLSDLLRERIQRDGPITFRDWMETALYHDELGYYCRRHNVRWGRGGDYRTSPERSSLFAATFARYFNRLFEQAGCPDDWTILEIGAGRGDFAERVLSTLRDQFPRMFAATRYVIDEIGGGRDSNSRLIELGNRVQYSRLGHLPSAEQGIAFSNELLDAFPIHRVTRVNGILKEFYVSLNNFNEFDWFISELSTERLFTYFETVEFELADDQIVEVNLEIADWFQALRQQLRNGYVVTVDYGAEASELFANRQEGTLRAFRRHDFVDVLAGPGEHDITTTVDWTFVKRVGERLGFATVEFASQDEFLRRAGLLEQLELDLAHAPDDATRARLALGAREMILPGGMAANFQVLVQRLVNE